MAGAVVKHWSSIIGAAKRIFISSRPKCNVRRRILFASLRRDRLAIEPLAHQRTTHGIVFLAAAFFTEIPTSCPGFGLDTTH
jgi:hypothetical protein